MPLTNYSRESRESRSRGEKGTRWGLRVCRRELGP